MAGSLATSAQPSGVIRPFNGKNLDGWKAKAEGSSKGLWIVGSARPDPADPKKLVVAPGGRELINKTPAHGQSLDLYSEALHGDAIITLEVMVPKAANSGIYVMGEYEVQVLDSFGKDANPGPGDMGAIYGAQPPQKPKYKAPGEWNTYEIHWQAPKFDATGKKTANARITVVHNGVTVHDNVELRVTGGSLDDREIQPGPLLLQDHGNPVQYRNIWVESVN